jgi:hypothetical protein
MKGLSMRLYMFTSQAKSGLHAFAGDDQGSKLPPKFAPWDLTGTLASRSAPPHNFSRQDIERAVEADGFQLWRMRPKD